MNDSVKFTAADDILAFIPHMQGGLPKEEKRTSDWCVTFRGSPAITAL
ncbi:hypothetical protein SAMN04487916_11158 [Arthrobacter sp. ov407]|nr:hypothetical protein SAMN04487916_11158 [Arthrobacter sp. ov407]